MNQVTLKESDRLEVTVLVDNYTDLLMLISTDTVKRPAVLPPNRLLAEHGFSLLIKVFSGEDQHTILMDTGASQESLFHNASILGIDLEEVDTVVLSHGHYDHFGGLIGFLNASSKKRTVILHPSAFPERRLNVPILPDPVDMTQLSESAITGTGAVIRKVDHSSALASDHILVSGEVERTTEFEQGMPFTEAKIDGEWVVDPFFDDQGLAVNVRGKGLVVISGCAHAGIVNTTRHLQKVTGVDTVHSILGGFHLTGPVFEPIIDPTINEIETFEPAFVVPMHCTGWKAINRFAERLPEQFVLNSVGTIYQF